MPANPFTPAEESLAFYYELGLAITQWAHVEQSMAWLVTGCFSFRERARITRGFFSIDNLRAKTKFVDSVLNESALKRSHLDEWNRLSILLERLSKLRNNLAHHTVMVYPHGRPGRRYAVIPRYNPPLKHKQAVPKPPSDAMCVRDIVGARLKFTALAFALEFLYFDIHGIATQLPASLAQAKDAPPLAQLTRQIRARFSLRLEPSEG